MEAAHRHTHPLHRTRRLAKRPVGRAFCKLGIYRILLSWSVADSSRTGRNQLSLGLQGTRGKAGTFQHHHQKSTTKCPSLLASCPSPKTQKQPDAVFSAHHTKGRRIGGFGELNRVIRTFCRFDPQETENNCWARSLSYYISRLTLWCLRIPSCHPRTCYKT
ncbi:hypothetical protein BC832DRAFT_203173 [Gaertneriomyces semiglobifer]|nr:hypothetical protein BC832DRAFT_203173 [Gaertneriomyces semiglobifer]